MSRILSCPARHDNALEPDPFLTEMRVEAPIVKVKMPYGEGPCWLVTRHADVRTVTSDRRFSRAALIGRDFPRITPAPIVQAEQINLMDPPTVHRVRRLVLKAFTSGKVEELRPRIQRIADELLTTMAAHGSSADVTAHLAEQLPLMTICELFGIPDTERPRLRARATAMMLMGPADRADAVKAKAELRTYFTEVTAQRRRSPGEDLLSGLATARIGDDMLDEDELAVLAMTLLVNGHDTTSYEISNILYTLLTHPAQLAQLRERPELLPDAIEELLRHIPFRQGVGIPRVATEDVDIDGVAIKAGDVVHVSYLTANRDDEVFECPDELDFERKDQGHMTFGYGSHHCLGSHLARMVLQVSIGTLLTRFPGLRLAVPANEIRWNTVSIWRFPLTLPVAW